MPTPQKSAETGLVRRDFRRRRGDWFHMTWSENFFAPHLYLDASDLSCCVESTKWSSRSPRFKTSSMFLRMMLWMSAMSDVIRDWDDADRGSA